MKRPPSEHPVSQLLDSVAASDGSTLPTDAELHAVALDEAGGHRSAAQRVYRDLRAAVLTVASHASVGHSGPARTAAREAAAGITDGARPGVLTAEQVITTWIEPAPKVAAG